MLKLEERRLQRIKNLGTGMLGKNQSEETKEKIRMAMKGREPSKKNRMAVSQSNKIRECSRETREKMKTARIGKLNGMLGKKHSEKTRNLISLALKKKARRGENHPCWKGGATSLQRQIKDSSEYEKWRKEVFKRDDWMCQDCNQIGGTLHPHHIKAFSIILMENNIKTLIKAMGCKEIWDVNNGKTLCKDCHKKTANYGNFKIYKSFIQEFPDETNT